MINPQTKLPLRDPRYRAPVMTVEAARGILNMDEDEVCEAVDLGNLIAWDIGADGSTRRELRILAASVAEFAEHVELGLEGTTTIDPPTACGMVVPGDKPWVTGKELSRALVCSSTHVCACILNGDLALMPGTKICRGKAGTPKITRASVDAFLRGRIEGGYE